MSGLDETQLRCFIAVAEEGHMGRAAARLHMSQPPLTRRISRLEREIGVRLFERGPAGMALTEPGRVLLERAYRIVRMSEHAVERTRRAQSGEVGRLIVGYFGSTVYDAVPRLLRSFLETRPEVELTLEPATKEEQADALRDGRMTLGFGRNYRDEGGLSVVEVVSEPLMLAAPDNLVGMARDAVSVADLRDLDLVLFPAASRPSFADEVEQVCRAAGFSPRCVREAPDVVSALAYAATGRMVTVVPRSAANVTMPGLRFMELRGAPEQQVSCIYRTDDINPVLHGFLGAVADAGPSQARC